MATTYTLISSVTVGTNTPSSIDFTSIPATYTDLLLVCSLRTTISGASFGLGLTLNSSTSNFTNRYLAGSGSSASSGTDARYLGEYNGSTSTASTFINCQIYFPNYASSNYKSFSVDNVQEDNSSGAWAVLAGGLWSNTSAITSIGLTRLSNSNGSFAQYSTAYLYGISNS